MVSVETAREVWEIGLPIIPGSNEASPTGVVPEAFSGDSGLSPSASRNEAVPPWCQWRPPGEPELLPLLSSYNSSLITSVALAVSKV